MSVFKKIKSAVQDYMSQPKNLRVDPVTGEVFPRRDEYGRETPDPVPLAPPIGWFKQPSMFDQVRDMVRGEHLRMYAEAQGDESFEDANDFDVDDDIFPASEHEGDFEPLESLQAKRQAEFREQFFQERDRRYRERKEREWASDPAKAPEARQAPSLAPEGPQATATPGGGLAGATSPQGQ